MDCIFCKIVAGEIPSTKIYEDDQVLAFLDINPVNPGHTLVIPNNHFSDLSQTPVEVLQDLIAVIKKIIPAIMKGVGAQGFNLGLNNGSSAGQIIFHTHFHLMPRFPNDGHGLWTGKTYTPGEMEKVAENIKKLL
ncbi:MAG TPA: HIT family protein [Patescibacteria group bacterium]|nr:HIT family protein [Patescibacteria group bacterium]